MNQALSRDIALRIGLAARALLPAVSVSDLIGILDSAVGLPLSAEKLDALTMKRFREAGGEKLLPVSADARKAALALLTQPSTESVPEPAITPYSEGDMPGSLRVAVASNGGERLDGHFGSCSHFLIYQVSATETRLIDLRPTAGDQDTEDRNLWRAQLISDCQVVHVTAIGGPAVAKIVRANIHPIKHAEPIDAPAVMREMQKVVAGAAPPWLARAMGREAETLSGFLVEAEQ